MTRHRRGPSLALVRRARERRALLAWERREQGMNVYTRTQLGDMARWRQEAFVMGHATTDERNTAPLPGQARHYLVEQADPVRDELAAIDALLDEMGIANLGTRLDRLRNLAQIAKGARDMVALVDRLRAERDKLLLRIADRRETIADLRASNRTMAELVADLTATVRRLRAEAGKAGRNAT